MTWKNDLCDKVTKLCRKAFITLHVRTKPLIHNGFSMQGHEALITGN